MEAGIVVAIILLISIIIGCRQGAAKIIWSILSMVIALVLAISLNPMVTDVLENTIHLDTYIEKYINNQLQEKSLEYKELEQEKVQEEFLDELNIPSVWKKSILKNNNADEYVKEGVSNFTNYTSTQLAQFSINIISFILTFILIKLILMVLSSAFNIVDNVINKIPIISQINKMTGILLSVAKGIIIIWIVMVVISIFSNYEWSSFLIQKILENPISAIFYKYNLLLYFM